MFAEFTCKTVYFILKFYLKMKTYWTLVNDKHPKVIRGAIHWYQQSTIIYIKKRGWGGTEGKESFLTRKT